MSPFVIGFLKTLLLEAAAILALLGPSLRRTRNLGAAYAALAGLVWLAFFNFGAIHGRGQLPHWAEQFHFDLGDKYLREVRYDGLYPATVAALAERGMRRPPFLRDTATFELVPNDAVERVSNLARQRFSPERWREFGDDLTAILSEEPTAASTGDHGNTASPAGAIVPWLLLAVVPLHGAGFRVLACADLVVLGLTFAACWRWASLQVATAAFALTLLAPYSTDYLVGSLFRFDWVAASLAGTLALWRGRSGTAGALFAYAALARPFALAFGLCAWAGLLGDVSRGTADRRSFGRFGVGALATASVLVIVSAVLFHPSIWSGYATRVLATIREGYYPMSHGFRNVYAQIVAEGPAAIAQPVPDFVAASHPGALSATAGLWIAQAVLTAAVLLMCLRDGAVMGAGAGVLLVFSVTVTNAYYQGMWGVLALACALCAPSSRRARAGIALACVAIGSRYVMEHFGELRYAQDYFANWTTFAFAAVWGLMAAWSPGPGTTATATDTPIHAGATLRRR
jgi:hypothetical protein